MWLPDGEKKFKVCLFVSTESTNVTDGHTQTDGQPQHDGIATLVHSIARQKSVIKKILKRYARLNYTSKIFSSYINVSSLSSSSALVILLENKI